jgi:hypothetical protein
VVDASHCDQLPRHRVRDSFYRAVVRALILTILVACTDAADVPTTLVHVHLTATCDTEFCYADVFYPFCGPDASNAVTPETPTVEIYTDYDAEDIAAFVQLQYTMDELPPGATTPAHVDQVIKSGEYVDVYSAYDYERLYRIDSDGGVVDIDTTKLTTASGNTLRFEYEAYGVVAQENHVIDAPIAVHVETDDPGIMDACCSVGRPRDGLLVGFALAFMLRRRRTRKTSAG